MSSTESKINSKITLEMSADTALVLKYLTQHNPNPDYPEDDSVKRARESIFEALPSVAELGALTS